MNTIMLNAVHAEHLIGLTHPRTTLWCREHIALHLGIATTTFRNQDFIDPDVKLSSNAKGDRWYAQSVIDYVNSLQFKAGRPRNAV